jgi:hypothetical protein
VLYDLKNPYGVDSTDRKQRRRRVIIEAAALFVNQDGGWGKVAEFQKTKLLKLYSS